MRAALWILAGSVVPTAASAEPWRGALAVELHHLTSVGRDASPTLRATGVGLHIRGERRLPGRRWSVAGGADAGVTGPVVVGSDRIGQSSLAVLGVAVGAGTDLGRRWRWRGLIGPSRVFYLSPRLVGDSGWDLGLAAETIRALTGPRVLDLGISARLATAVGNDGGVLRATIAVSLGIELAVGR